MTFLTPKRSKMTQNSHFLTQKRHFSKTTLYIFWFACDGLYRLDSATLSNLEQIHFLSKDNVVKSVAASSYHVAALLANGKIVIKSILNNKVTTILNDSRGSKMSSILSSEYGALEKWWIFDWKRLKTR